MNPKISVIVPIYNVEKYLEKCISSLLDQSFTDFELILVNDGSPDNCGKICDEFKEKDSRITVLHLENGGVCRARNKGMELATGDFYVFVDSDDWVEQDYLKDFADYIEDDYTILQQEFYRDFPSRTSSFELGHQNKTYDLMTEFDKMITENKIIFAGFVWNKLFSAKIIKQNKILFDGSTLLADDEEFCLKYLEKIHKVHNVSKANYHYIDNPNSITKRKLTFEMEWKRFLFQTKYFDFVRKNYSLGNLAQEYISRLNFERFEHSIYRKYIVNQLKEATERLKTISKYKKMFMNDLLKNAKKSRLVEYTLLKYSLYLPLKTMLSIKAQK